MTNTLTQTTKIYDEFVEFIAEGTTPETLTQFQYSEPTKERIEDLIYRSKMGELTAEQKNELDKFLVLEHLITLAKAKAYQHLQNQSKQ